MKRRYADPEKIGRYFREIEEPRLNAGDDALVCGHSWYDSQHTRPHVGDVICFKCGRQDHVYDWDFYDALTHIPEPGKRGSLQPAPQGETRGDAP